MLALVLFVACDIAVIPHAPPEASPEEVAQAREFTDELIKAFDQEGKNVLKKSELRERLAPLRPHPKTSTREIQTDLDAASEALAAGEIDRSIELSLKAIDALQSDLNMSEASRKLLQTARLRLAGRLLGLANGKNERSLKNRAKAQLLAAASSDSSLALSEVQYPPKLRKLFDEVKQEVGELGQGTLVVTTPSPGAKVFVEGRALGSTPLQISNTLAPGTYRVWATKDGFRSRTQVATLDEGSLQEPVKIEIPLSLEEVFAKDEGVFSPASTTPEEVQNLRAYLGTDVLALVGVSNGNAYGVIIDAKGKTQKALVQKGNDDTAKRFLICARGKSKCDSTMMPTAFTGFAQSLTTTLNSGSPNQDANDESSSWGPIALIAGGGLVLATAAAGVAYGVFFYTPVNGTFDVVVPQ